MADQQEKKNPLTGLHQTEPELRILLVEDNPGDVLIFKSLLKFSSLNFSLTQVGNLKEAYKHFIGKEFDILLLDLGLPESTGLETLKKVHDFNITSPIIVMTGLDDQDVALDSLREGAQDYLVKHKLTTDNIVRSIRYSIERKKIQNLQKKHTHQFSILSSATGLINKCEDIGQIYSITCDKFRDLLGNANSIALRINKTKLISAFCIDWLIPWTEQIKKLTGLDMNDRILHFDDQENLFNSLFKEGKLKQIEEGLYQLFSGQVGKSKCLELEKLIGAQFTYAIGFIKETNFYGGAIIFSNKKILDDDTDIIETIGIQTSLSIHKKTIEKELRLSENRYKNLNLELEEKVKTRTADLNSLNIRLEKELIERIEIQEVLKQSESQLIELNATKDKFFNIVAHDLKNPFTSLLGATELLFDNIEGMNEESIRELALILNDSAKSGYAILQNLLDWSRSQTGLLRINPERINLKQLLKENIQNLELFSSNKKITFNSFVNDNLVIDADRNMVDTILRNLLSNAIKFSYKNGNVIIRADYDSDYVTISIKDNGMGIPQSKIANIFRIDSQFTMPGTEKEQGTGLGLKLCKEFVEKLGGNIRVESIENKGSEFLFTIPKYYKSNIS